VVVEERRRRAPHLQLPRLTRRPHLTRRLPRAPHQPHMQRPLRRHPRREPRRRSPPRATRRRKLPRRALRKPPAQRRSSLPVRRADREPRLLRDTHRRRPRRLGRSSSKPAAAMLGAVARELRNRVRAKTWVDSPGWATAATSLHNKMWLRNKV
jgi:hypothetical protein